MKFCQCNSPNKQNDRKKTHMVILLDAEKAFGKIHDKGLERAEMQGTYITII